MFSFLFTLLLVMSCVPTCVCVCVFEILCRFSGVIVRRLYIAKPFSAIEFSIGTENTTAEMRPSWLHKEKMRNVKVQFLGNTISLFEFDSNFDSLIFGHSTSFMRLSRTTLEAVGLRASNCENVLVRFRIWFMFQFLLLVASVVEVTSQWLWTKVPLNLI